MATCPSGISGGVLSPGLSGHKEKVTFTDTLAHCWLLPLAFSHVYSLPKKHIHCKTFS